MQIRSSAFARLSLSVMVTVTGVLVGVTGVAGPASAFGILVAAPAAVGGGTCADAANACTLETALTRVGSGGVIDLTAGTYQPGFGSSFTIGISATLQPATTGAVITLQGNGASVLVVNAAKTATIIGVTITGGVAVRQGGGIANAGTLTVENSTISNNTVIGTAGSTGSAGSAGAAGTPPGTLICLVLTCPPNPIVPGPGTPGGTGGTGGTGGAGGPAQGGGIFSTGPLTVENSTISGNSATGGTGGAGGDGGAGGADAGLGAGTPGAQGVGGAGGIGQGGGIFSSGTATVEDSTIAANSAVFGPGGIGVPTGANGLAQGDGIFEQTATVTVAASIVANYQLSGDCAVVGGGAVADSGYNIDSDGSCGWSATGSVSGSGVDGISLYGTVLDSYLGGLSSNGGPTQTVPLLSNQVLVVVRPRTGSPAGLPNPAHKVIPASFNLPTGPAACSVPDQRGTARPTTCDMGAFQLISSSVIVTPPPPVPVITLVTPSSGPAGGGTAVTITGTNLGNGAAVYFGMAQAIVTAPPNASSGVGTETVTSPPGTGTVDIRINGGVGWSIVAPATDSFTYSALPFVASVSPSKGSTIGGTPITITGTNFTGATAANIGAGNPCVTAFTVVSSTTITCTTGSGNAATVDVTVTTLLGTSSSNPPGDSFTYLAIPTVTGISPTSGPIGGGTAITITGTNFTGATAANIGAGNPCSNPTVVSSTTITCTTPKGTAGTVDVTVTTPVATSAVSVAPSTADQFTYQAIPPALSLYVGAGPTGGPQVASYQTSSISGSNQPTATSSFFAFDPGFHGGIGAMVTSLDGNDLYVGPGAGGGPNVSIFNTRTGTLVASFFAFNPVFHGGIGSMAMSPDGKYLYVGAGPGGGPQVSVFTTASILAGSAQDVMNFYAFPSTFGGGIDSMALSPDGKDLYVGAGSGGGPQVAVFTTASILAGSAQDVTNFFAFDKTFGGGVRSMAISSDGKNLYVGAGAGGGPQVSDFATASILAGGTTNAVVSFFAYTPAFQGGVGSMAISTDGSALYTGAGAGGGPQVSKFTTASIVPGATVTAVGNFYAYDPKFAGGVGALAVGIPPTPVVSSARH